MSGESGGDRSESERHDQLVALARRRWWVATVLTATMMVTYFGFLFVVAYAKPTAGALVTSGLSWGILLGALMIVIAWCVTAIYVAWANKHYDTKLEELRRKRSSASEAS